MSAVFSSLKTYVTDPLQNEVRTFAEDLGVVNSWVSERVFDVCGNRRAAAITGIFLSVIVIAAPYFLAPWQLIVGVMAAYECSKLKLPTFERGLAVAAFVDMTRQLVCFAAKNLTKQAGAFAHLVNASVAGAVALSLLIQSNRQPDVNAV